MSIHSAYTRKANHAKCKCQQSRTTKYKYMHKILIWNVIPFLEVQSFCHTSKEKEIEISKDNEDTGCPRELYTLLFL